MRSTTPIGRFRLPLYPKMTDRDADDVVDAVRKVIMYFRR